MAKKKDVAAKYRSMIVVRTRRGASMSPRQHCLDGGRTFTQTGEKAARKAVECVLDIHLRSGEIVTGEEAYRLIETLYPVNPSALFCDIFTRHHPNNRNRLFALATVAEDAL